MRELAVSALVWVVVILICAIMLVIDVASACACGARALSSKAVR